MADEILTGEKQGRAAQAAQDAALAGDDDAAMLARLGYRQELRRTFTLFEVFGIAFSIFGLLPSIASTLSYSIPAGPAGMVWGWFICSIFIFIIGLAMADLGSAMPTSGGLYWWTHYFSSPKLRNVLSFLVGYSNTLGLCGCLVSIDYGFSLMFLSVIVIATDGAFSPSNGAVYAVFLACVLLHGIFATVLNRVMGKLQTFFVVMNFVVIIATIIALPIGRASQRNDATYIFTTTANLTEWPAGWTFMLGFLSPIWTMSCFDSTVHMSEEASNASRAVPYGILMAIGTGWLCGFIIMIVLAACMSTDLASITGSAYGQPMAQIYYDAVGKHGAMALMTLLFTVQFLMGLSTLVAVSRQSWAFSRDGALPFSRALRAVSPLFGCVPLRAIWFCASLAACLGLLALIDSAAAEALFSLAVAGNYFAWLVPIMARVVWGRDRFKPGPFYTGRFSVPIAWVAVAFILFAICLSMFPVGGPHPSPTTMNYTIVVCCAVWFGALGYYLIDARKWFTGPKMTLEIDEGIPVDCSPAEEEAQEQEKKLVKQDERAAVESDGA